MYLLWRKDSTAKGAKKCTLPNVLRLQYRPTPLLSKLVWDEFKLIIPLAWLFLFP